MIQTFTSVAGGDGNVYVDNGGTWATVRSATSGTAQAGSDPVGVYASQLTSRSIGRIFIPFDTSLLPDLATIVSATITFNVTAVLSASGTIHAIQTTQADPTSLVGEDYDTVIFMSGGSVAVSATGSKVITLNATARGWINIAGYSKFGLIEDHDLTNTDPVTTDHRFTVNMAENATIGDRPTLSVEYTLAENIIVPQMHTAIGRKYEVVGY